MNPITLDFPDQFETERLLIRAPRLGDGAILYRAISDSLEEVLPWMPWAQNPPTLEESESVARQARANWMQRTDLMLLVFEKNGRLIGASGLHRPDWEVPKFEIGYWRHSDHGGRGFMTEAVRGIADFAFDKLSAERVEIHCSTRNLRSAALARRAGFTLEATLRSHRRWLGDLHDEMIFARVKGEKQWNFTSKVLPKLI